MKRSLALALMMVLPVVWGCSPSADTPVADSSGTSATEPAATTQPEAKPTAEPEAESTDVSPTDALQALMDEYRKAEREFTAKLRSAPRQEQMKMALSGGAGAEMAPKFIKLAKQFADTDIEFTALKFAGTNGNKEAACDAFDQLTEKYGEDERLAKYLSTFVATFQRSVQLPQEYHENFLSNLSEKSGSKAVQGAAMFALIKFRQTLVDMKQIANSPIASQLPEETVAFLKRDRGEDFDSQMEEMLQKVATEFADVEVPGAGKIGEKAEEELYVYKYLMVGKTAPNIEGIDLDGKEFQLADYRGKVVMLDFWGDW